MIPLLHRRRPFPATNPEPITQFLSTYLTAGESLQQSFPTLNHPPHPPHDDDEEETIDISDRSHWTRKIHSLCAAPGAGVDDALRLLDRLRLRGYRPDSLNLKSIIHALCAAGRHADAHRRLLFSLAANRDAHDDKDCNVLIARLLDSKTPGVTLGLIKCLWRGVKPEFVPSLVNFNRLIHQFCLVKQPESAHRLLIEMGLRGVSPNVVSYTTLMGGYCGIGQAGDAEKVFDEMSERGVSPNSLTLSVLVHAVLQKRDVDHGKRLIGRLWEEMRCRVSSSSSVNNAAFAHLMDTLCEEGLFHEVFEIAESMPQKGVVTDEFAYAQMIDSLCKSGKHHGASRILYIMRKKSLKPSMAAYNAIIHGLSEQGGCMRAFQLFEEGIQLGYVPSEFTYKVLVESLCNDGDLSKAKDVLRFMLKKKNSNRARIYNIYLRAVRVADNTSELLSVLELMIQSQDHPDVVTLNTILDGLCKSDRIEDAMQIFNDMMTGKFCDPDTVTFTTVIHGLLSIKNVKDALDLLYKEMPERGAATVVTYNVVIRGLYKLQRPAEAEEVYETMVAEGVVAGKTTYTVMIDGLFEVNQVDEAKRFWDEVVWPSKLHDDFVYAAVVKGLCRCGKLSDACDFLCELVDCGVSPNVVSYNILIDNARKGGLKKLAYRILGEMKKNGVSPDAVTWRILDKVHEDPESKFFQKH